jgi:hypothetical protein
LLVSSILKALKKVEDVQPEPRRTENWSHAFDSGEAIRKQARRSQAVRTGLVALVAVVALGAGGWWLYGQGLGRWGATPPAGEAETGSREGGTVASEAPRRNVPAISKPEPARAAPPKPAAEASRPVAAGPTARETPPAIPGESPAPSEPAAVAQAAPAASAGPETAEPLDTSRVRLEAIVWSSEPGSRFAVINGNILRQGGTVDGMTVTAIERNSVKLRSGNRAGEIRFDRD